MDAGHQKETGEELTVPGHLGRLLLILAKDNPGVVLREGEVDVIVAEDLAAGHHGEGDAEAVQLVALIFLVGGREKNISFNREKFHVETDMLAAATINIYVVPKSHIRKLLLHCLLSR